MRSRGGIPVLVAALLLGSCGVADPPDAAVGTSSPVAAVPVTPSTGSLPSASAASSASVAPAAGATTPNVTAPTDDGGETGAAPSRPAASSTATSKAPEPSTPPATASSTPDLVPGSADPDAASSGFRSAVITIDAALRTRMSTSWRPGCPVGLEDLRYVTVTYHDFAGLDRQGELVVAADVADEVVHAFEALYEADYPIASMRLVDDFDGSDDASMAADNTSAFNCRNVTGGTSFSEHSYGSAIDVNPVQNPYRRSGTVLPAAGAAFVDRPERPGVIHAGDSTVQAFAAIGWSWGGDWSSPTDYQHFSRSGR